MPKKAKSTAKKVRHYKASKSLKKVAVKSRLDKLLDSRDFGPNYAAWCLLALFFSTLFWSILGANLQRGNADQLINSYLLDSTATFKGAHLPGQHSFLFKWPLLLLVRLFGTTTTTVAIFTIIFSMLTVGALAYILYKLEKRPVVFGTLCLALASCLLLVPATPYAGGILPVNMAMLTTRNLEYVLYLLGLYWIVRAKKLWSWHYIAAIGVLALLFASDKLFLSLSVAGALLVLSVYLVLKKWQLVRLAAKWLLAGVIAGALATVALWLLNHGHVVHISNEATASPYGVIRSAHDLALAGIFMVLGLATNFGANPAFDATRLHDIPTNAISRIGEPGGIAFLVNALILAVGLVFVVRFVWSTLKSKNGQPRVLNKSNKLSVMLIASSIVSLVVFVGSKHYYAVDARYLSICLFAVFITTASVLRLRRLSARVVVLSGFVIFIAACLGLFSAFKTYSDSQKALSKVNKQNALIAQVLSQHQVDTLVGDYWRVVPTKLESDNHLNILPLSDCTTPRSILNSDLWETNLKNHSFAYLLSLDRSLTDFPTCSFDQVVKTYGQPNSSAVLSGSIAKPHELLLFYDHGVQSSTSKKPTQTIQSILPIPIAELPNSRCATQTIMQVVAHQDDDLLFMSPDLIHSLKAGDCVRTIYVTAGDAGGGDFYWLGREKGSEAAYSEMLGIKQDWVQQTVKVSEHAFATTSSPTGFPQVSLVFLHLPDGNMNGIGFRSSHFASLDSLDHGRIPEIRSIDRQSDYTSEDLVNALTEFMKLYNPAEVRTQSNDYGFAIPDHSDHRAVGRFATKAFKAYANEQTALKYYMGYPIHLMAENVEGEDLDQKAKAFFAYGQLDPNVCRSLEECDQSSVYGIYLRRQYTSEY